MPNLGPIPGALVQDRYHIDAHLWRAMDPCERAMFRMAFAADIWHVEEIPIGSNCGPEIERVLRLAGVDRGNPWCASIWTAYLMDSGVGRAALPAHAASVHGWGEWAHAEHRMLSGPERGCAGLIFHDAKTGHLVAVTGAHGGQVDTIAGNTNVDGSREGYGVFRKTYRQSDFALFVDCRGLA